MSDPHSAPQPPAPSGDASAKAREAAPHEAHDAEHFHNHAGLYLTVGGILMLGTALTVYLAYVDFGSHELNVAMGLLVATVKALLVALIFMHLKSEKMAIYQCILITIIFVVALFGLSVLGFFDHIRF